VAEAAGRIGERGGHRVQAIEPDGAAWRVRCLLAGGVVALAVGAVVVAGAVALLVVLGAVVERLPLGARAVLARGLGALRTGVQRVAALVRPLLAVVRLAVVAGGAAWAAA
jgi:hypothetical protein